MGGPSVQTAQQSAPSGWRFQRDDGFRELVVSKPDQTPHLSHTINYLWNSCASCTMLL